MSRDLESLLDAERRADCAHNDVLLAAGMAVAPIDRHLHTSNFRLRFPRSSDQAFRTAEYARPIVHYTRAPWYVRAWRAFWRWC